MEHQEEKKELSLWVWIALLAVLVIGVVGIFLGLEKVMPQQWEAQQQQQAVEQTEQLKPPAPNFCPYCGDSLPETFEWGRFCPYCGKIVDC